MPLNIHDDFWGVDFWCAIISPYVHIDMFISCITIIILIVIIIIIIIIIRIIDITSIIIIIIIISSSSIIAGADSGLKRGVLRQPITPLLASRRLHFAHTHAHTHIHMHIYMHMYTYGQSPY